MCGLLGYFGAYDSGKLTAGLTAIAHRGPDDSGEFVDPALWFSFGYRYLAIDHLLVPGDDFIVHPDRALLDDAKRI